MVDVFGDRMKQYEAMTSIQLMPMLPILARIDGRSFHSFTRGMEAPFDSLFRSCMEETTVELCRETNALVGYTQSDEITLLIYSSDYKSEVWFGGKHSKMVSQLAAQATLIFNRMVAELMPGFVDRRPTFDARVWQVPNKVEAVNVFVWREQDAVRNSIQSAARSVYSQKKLFGKSCNELQELLFQKGINWNDYSARFKRGAYFRRATTKRKFTTDEIARLPEKHEARRNPDLQVERSDIVEANFPKLTQVENRVDVFFEGVEPQVIGEPVW